ncbi:hypothetical protein, partial [Actinoplanes couchii]|uniref:hypothetical protein n=1 Tax=Actinoplanes couchii TaxID=403638 RepID=UPI001940F39E
MSRQQAELDAVVERRAGQLSAAEIANLIDEVGDMVTVLRRAEPEAKLERCRNLGLRLTYLPKTKTVRADVNLAAHRYESGCVRGPTLEVRTRLLSVSWASGVGECYCGRGSGSWCCS